MGCTAGCQTRCRTRSWLAFGQLLSPATVAYVGYNTYPGWKAKEIVRDAMLLSAGDSATI
jgi:hypothetical protein